MSARRIAERPGSVLVAQVAPADHPWRVVLVVLISLVVVLGCVAIAVVAATSGLVSDVWQAATSVFERL